jgi:murein DD-endopeptidase MepM/ murein hydrolase activator NlpD
MTHFLQRTALIALATGALGACSTTDTDGALRPNYPVRAPEAPPPPANPAPAAPAPAATPPPSDMPATAAPAAPVEQRPLAPLPPIRPAPPPRAAAPPPPAPVYRTVTTRSVTGKVVEVEGPAAAYKVKKGDTLYSIARRFGVTADAIRDENDLGPNAGLRLGQKLRLPDGYRDHGPLTATNRVLVSGVGAAPAPTADETTPEVEEAPQAPRSAPGRPQASYPAASAPAQPSYRTVTSRTVTGKVVEVEGPAVSYKVKKGDSLEKIARKLETTVDQLRDDNDIGRREAIQPGQTLKGPRSAAKAYVAGAGDTLYAIARRFGVTAEALRDENDLSRNVSLRPGQKLRLPDGYKDQGPLTSTTRVAVPPPASQASAPPPAPRPYSPPQPALQSPSPAAPTPAPTPRPYTPPPATSGPRPYVPPPRAYTPPVRPYTPPPQVYAPPAGGQGPVAGPTSAPTPADAQLSELGRGRFVWPLQGTIISDFGPKAPGQRNDGINIGAQIGASIRAAAAGDVVYAGDQVPGFGNLVLIKHANGWVTAYGHLSRVMVKMQQKVTQGQEIGLAGATGGVSEPQLHFEVRYAASPLERAKPIDPKLVLPR